MNNNFEDFNLNKDIIKSLNNLNYKKPSRVQSEVIPNLLNKENVIVKSQTGSGKTASFAIPICESIDINDNNVQALIVAPTRELALQIKEESGLLSLKPLLDMPLSIEILGVQPHYKKQKYVSAHLHLNYTFLLHNTKEEKLKICPEENSKVGWLSPDEAVRSSTEAWMKPIYEKLNQKMKEYL